MSNIVTNFLPFKQTFKMKHKLLWLALASLTIFTSSCDKVKDALKTNVSISPSDVNATIPIISNTTENQTIGEFNLNLDLGALIKEQVGSMGIKNLKSVKIKSFKITLTDANDANNFANMEKIEGRLSASGQAEIVVVSVLNNPDTYASSLTIPSSGDIELKNLVTGTQVKYSLKGKLRRATTKTLAAKITAQYNLVLGVD